MPRPSGSGSYDYRGDRDEPVKLAGGGGRPGDWASPAPETRSRPRRPTPPSPPSPPPPPPPPPLPPPPPPPPRPWREVAGQAGRAITRIAAAFEAGRDGF